MMTDYKFSKKSTAILKTIDGRLQALTYSVLANSPYDFGIPKTGGRRTAKEQNELFKKKWSKLDGYKKKSYHQSGMAVDIYLYDEHGICYDCIDRYWEIKQIFFKQFDKMKALGIFNEDSYIRSGMDWNRNNIRVDKDIYENFMDMPHFELRNII